MNALQKKVGPLPVWGWGAAITLGVLIFYWQKRNGGGVGTAASQAASQPVLDPTQGSFPMPSGLSAGGTAADAGTASPLGDGLTWSDVPSILSLMPAAPAASAAQEPTSGVQTVTDTATIIKTLQDTGLIAKPAASTGAATSAPQSHTKPKPASQRATNTTHNSRQGQTYRVVTNPHGKPAGTYHVYGAGKKAEYVKVKPRKRATAKK